MNKYIAISNHQNVPTIKEYLGLLNVDYFQYHNTLWYFEIPNILPISQNIFDEYCLMEKESISKMNTKIVHCTNLDLVRIDILGEGRAKTFRAKDILDCEEKIEKIREISECSPDCPLEKWMKVLIDTYHQKISDDFDKPCVEFF